MRARSFLLPLLVVALGVAVPLHAREGIAPPSDAEKTSALAAADAAWQAMDEILARIKPPAFPDKDFEITRYGAKGDGVSDCSEAFARAIATCSEAGGGRVVVPAGDFLTGPIHLRSNVNLHTAKGATVLFKTETSAYMPPVFARYESTEVMNFSPFIYAHAQENIAITGEGTFDGQARKGAWYAWKSAGGSDVKKLVQMGDDNVPVAERVFGEGKKLRPNFVQPVKCKNVLIEGVRFTNSPMWVLNPVLCTNVTVRRVTVDTKGEGSKAPNTDGCDPESSTDVLIEDCVFNTDDDCIAIKSGRDNDGRRVNVPSTNIIIRGCKFAAGHGGVTAGSETAGGIRNVFVENCSFDSPDLAMAIRLKSNPRRGGFIENFNVRNCTVKTAETGIHMTMKYEKVTEGAAIPFIRGVRVQNVNFEKLTKQPVFIEGLSPEAKISDVKVIGCTFPEMKKPSTIENAEGVAFIDVKGI